MSKTKNKPGIHLLTTPGTRFVGKVGTRDEYYWHIVASNGRIIARSGDFPSANYKVIDYIDGLCTPGGTAEQGKAQFSMVGPFTIIAWHDYTVDSRPGSNSNIIGYGFTGTRAEIIVDMFKDFMIRFPQVVNRQTQPINVADYGIIYSPKIPSNG